MRKTTTDSNSNRSASGVDGLTRRRRRQREDGSNNSDGLAASRARAAKREEAEEVIGLMAMRLQALWDELKIPSPDRAYVAATYLEAGGRGGGRDGDGSKGAKGASADVYHELVRQIRLLLEHRAATIQVNGMFALCVETFSSSFVFIQSMSAVVVRCTAVDTFVPAKLTVPGLAVPYLAAALMTTFAGVVFPFGGLSDQLGSRF